MRDKKARDGGEGAFPRVLPLCQGQGLLCVWSLVSSLDKLSSLTSRSLCSAQAQGGLKAERPPSRI